jgi:hypothetical protein
MESITYKATRNTPHVHLDPVGEITFEGKCVPENSFKLFEPIVDWLEQLKAPTLRFNMKMEYLDTSSINQVFKMLKQVSENPTHKEILVNWYYEEDDEDILEEGKYFASILKNLEFRFIMFAEI